MSTPPTPVKHEEPPSEVTKTSSTDEEAPLSMAEEGQLQWVKRSLSSLSVLNAISPPMTQKASGETSDDDDDDDDDEEDAEDPPSLWWPSLLFNDYDDFQKFFKDEFQTDPEAPKTKELIMKRMLHNMRQQQTIMVARLVGRSIREYVEIVESPSKDDEEGKEGEEEPDGSLKVVEAHQATEFVSFTHMPQEIHLPQMEPAMFIGELPGDADGSENEPKESNTIIDDELYMSYMLALDLSGTKRFGGPPAPSHELGNQFREIGRAKLAELPDSVQRLSVMKDLADFLPDLEDKPLEETMEGGGENPDTQVEIPLENKTEEASPQDQQAIDPVKAPETSKAEGSQKAEECPKQGTEVHSSSATVISQSSDVTDGGNSMTRVAPTVAPALSPTRKSKRGRKPKRNDSDTEEESAPAPKKSVTTKTPPKPRGRKKTKVGASEDAPVTATPSKPSPPKRRGRPPKKKMDVEEETESAPAPIPAKASPPKRRGRRPKKKADELDEAEDAPITATPTKASPPKRRGRPPKKKIDVSENAESVPAITTSTEASPPKRRGRPSRKKVEALDDTEKAPVATTDSTPRKRGRPKKNADVSDPIVASPPKKRRGRPPKSVVNTPQPSKRQTEEVSKSSALASPAAGVKSLLSPKKKLQRRRTKKKVSTPKASSTAITPKVTNLEKDRGAAKENSEALASTVTALSFQSPPPINRRAEGLSEGADSPPNKNIEEKLSDGSQGGDATVSETPFSTVTTPENSTLPNDPKIVASDSFNDVCNKLELIGWTIDTGHDQYFDPTAGFDDAKANPQWAGKKFFLDKATFVAFLGETYGWGKVKTPKKRSRKSNTVTPTPSVRPKRSRRTPAGGVDAAAASLAKNDFKSEEERTFYHFPNLMKKLRLRHNWGYLPSKIHPWHYVIPGCKRESKGGKVLEDFFYDESDVIQYCMNKKYFENRRELGLEDRP